MKLVVSSKLAYSSGHTGGVRERTRWRSRATFSQASAAFAILESLLYLHQRGGRKVAQRENGRAGIQGYRSLRDGIKHESAQG